MYSLLAREIDKFKRNEIIARILGNFVESTIDAKSYRYFQKPGFGLKYVFAIVGEITGCTKLMPRYTFTRIPSISIGKYRDVLSVANIRRCATRS